ncbi:DUF454 family protein [Rouxiella chamberiensis]|uniref:DUF454 family protein n=1 Tax=Rouxiella chamberiensis TaxID=1513468 RepID=UPI0005D3BE93|nr:DUF454 family protein [Rouxiella chamberiensis]
MKRYFLIAAGWLAVVLATLGVVLPLLPTTPFLLLAAWCFARSSPRFHAWLLYRSWFGRYLRFWNQHHALPPNTKWKAMLMTVVTFAVSLYFVPLWWLRLLLIIMLCGLLILMWRLPVVDLEQ